MNDALLRFANDEDCRDVVYEIGWKGEWPPPEDLYLVTGMQTGRMTVAEDADVDRVKRDYPDWQEHVLIQRFHRARASTMSDEAADHPHVLRGAVYTPVFVEVDL